MSFYNKAELEQFLKPDIVKQNYYDLLEDLWPHLLNIGMSFVVKRAENGEIVGTTINYDAHDEPHVEVNSRLSTIFEFLEFIEAPIV